jgi:hypothetical protein
MVDVIGGMRRLQRQAGRRLPSMRRSRRPSAAMVTAPIVAVAGVAAVAGLLFWDERRRTAMRKRMEEVAGSVTASLGASKNRVAPPVPTGAAHE